MIGRLKPPLDFYYAYRQWIVRYYPPHIKQPGSVEQTKTWTAMKWAIDGWNDLRHADREAWSVIVRNAMRTGKDFYYRCRLLGATETPYSWKWLNVYNMRFVGNRVRFMVKKSPGTTWRIWWCNGEDNQKTYYWEDEGYCIRGRRMSVKRNLRETWSKNKKSDWICLYPYVCYSIWVGPNVNEVHCTFKLSGLLPAGTHGRTGVYVVRR